MKGGGTGVVEGSTQEWGQRVAASSSEEEEAGIRFFSFVLFGSGQVGRNAGSRSVW